MGSEKLFDIPKLLYFQSGNCFSGSIKNFAYKIIPKDGSLSANVWEGRNCMDQSEILASKEFPMEQDGPAELVDWLIGQYNAFLQKASK